MKRIFITVYSLPAPSVWGLYCSFLPIFLFFFPPPCKAALPLCLICLQAWWQKGGSKCVCGISVSHCDFDHVWVVGSAWLWGDQLSRVGSVEGHKWPLWIRRLKHCQRVASNGLDGHESGSQHLKTCTVVQNTWLFVVYGSRLCAFPLHTAVECLLKYFLHFVHKLSVTVT